MYALRLGYLSVVFGFSTVLTLLIAVVSKAFAADNKNDVERFPALYGIEPERSRKLSSAERAEGLIPTYLQYAKRFGATWLVLCFLSMLTPTRQGLIEGYVMIAGQKALTADNVEAAVKALREELHALIEALSICLRTGVLCDFNPLS